MTDLESTAVAHPDPMLRALVDGRYQVEHRIAEGGFGAVYCATDTVTRRVVALKVLHPHLAYDATMMARFRREADVLACLHDPHTVAMVGAGIAIDGTAYIAMELLSGPSLLELMCAHGTMPWPRANAIVRGICRSLTEAHALGIVHRDLKPSNIIVEPRGGEPDFVKVIDFGIAKPVRATSDADVTRVGHMIGTFEYMSPEQMLGGRCTPQSDVFALGILLYELISGRRPFGQPETASAMVAAVLGTIPAELDDVPVELARVVARCLACESAHRYADAAALGAALDAVQASADACCDDDRKTDIIVVLDRARLPRPKTIMGHVAFARGSRPRLEPPRRTPAGTSAPATEPEHARPWVTLAAIVLAIVALLASA